VPCIGEQCQRTGAPAVIRLDDDEDNIQRDAQREGAIKRRRGMRVAVLFGVVGGGNRPQAARVADGEVVSAFGAIANSAMTGA
jgi:hypothetical protein